MASASAPTSVPASMAFKRIFDSLQEMEVTLRHVLQLDEAGRLRIFEYLVTSKDVKSDEFEQAIRKIGGTDMSTIAEQWIEQGRLEGELKGKLEGKLEGELKGKLEGSSNTLRALIKRKFGTIPGTVQSRIEQANYETLQRYLENIIDAKAPEDVVEIRPH